MKMGCFRWSGAAAILALLAGAPVNAADDSGVRTAAEELGQRTNPAATPEGQQKGGLSDNAVRVLMNYAFTVIPDQQPGPDGKQVKLDKSDPNKFAIPDVDARRVIRAATRSAYAEACDLPDLAQANYQALIRSEGAKRVWTEPQLLMVNALYLFSASYFAGNVKITEGDAAASQSSGAEAGGAAKEAAPQQGTDLVTPKRPQCPPEQKQKVVAAINAYVQSVPTAGTAAPGAQPATVPEPCRAHRRDLGGADDTARVGTDHAQPPAGRYRAQEDVEHASRLDPVAAAAQVVPRACPVRDDAGRDRVADRREHHRDVDDRVLGEQRCLRPQREHRIAPRRAQLLQRGPRALRVRVGVALHEGVADPDLLQGRADAGERRQVVGGVVPQEHAEPLLRRRVLVVRGHCGRRQRGDQHRDRPENDHAECIAEAVAVATIDPLTGSGRASNVHKLCETK